MNQKDFRSETQNVLELNCLKVEAQVSFRKKKFNQE